MATNSNSSLYQDTAHLLRRAGFGSPPDEIQRYAALGLSAATDLLINYEQAPDNIDDDALIESLTQALPNGLKGIAQYQLPVQVVKIWWTYRMIATQRPLQEKMTLFWHNHFTSAGQGLDGDFMLQQNQLYRRHALGNFRTLTLEVSRNPEMLRYLNGNQNFKAHANENYGRELMELFTCGRVDQNGKPNYTEHDVKASSRAFTGWNMRGKNFYFNPYQHDNSIKTFMGHTGNLDGDDIVDILVAMPSTGYRICKKLFRYLAYDDPEPAVLDALVKTYFATGYDIRAIVTQILHSNAFYSDKARYAVIKQPAQFVVGTVRMAGLQGDLTPPPNQITQANDTETPLVPQGQTGSPAQPRARRLGPLGALGRLAFMVNSMRNMGQDILNPPTVKGWDGGEMWINTDTLQARERFAEAVCAQPDLPMAQLADAQTGPDEPLARTAQFAWRRDAMDSAKLVDGLLWQFGPLPVSEAVRQTLVQFADSQTYPQAKVRGVLSLILGTPEYQVC